jgi:hypothetical protein
VGTSDGTAEGEMLLGTAEGASVERGDGMMVVGPPDGRKDGWYVGTPLGG